MSEHIELNRTFWPVNDDTDYDPDSFRFHSAYGGKSSEWSELLQSKRVVILAEAGTGKTHELVNIARKMINDGNSAFFCRIEDLAELSVEEAITEGTYDQLKAWKQQEEEAWFFLDSVDEARLANPRDFERALRRVAKELGDAAKRSHIYITSRVSDWMANADRALVNEVLPCPQSNAISLAETHNRSPKANGQSKLKIEQSPQEELLVFRLAPLNVTQMQAFAAAKGVSDVVPFTDAIDRADAFVFAERPQDLIDLISFWQTNSRIGLYSEMVEYNIRQKLLEANRYREEKRPLSLVRAKEGAENIAAALTMSRRNSVVLPDYPVDPTRTENAIWAKEVLDEWEPQEINALLDRALFDVATYGRVRIHHRSIREHLTARWLLGLLNQGKNRRSIEQLIFATCHGIELIIPSMEPIAGWLALYDERVCQRIIKIEPEVLIANGDPSSLPISVRQQLLRKFADLYANRKTNHFSFDIAAVRRLADSKLANCINELLVQYKFNEEITGLLLRMVWQGEITECAESALSLALDRSADRYTRIYAIRAISVAGSDNQKLMLARNISAEKIDPDTKILAEICGSFFPNYLSVDDLLTILEIAPPPKRFSVSDLAYVLEKTFEDISNDLCLPLLNGLIRLVEQEPHEERSYCQISKKYKWLFPHAVILARRAITISDAMWQDESVLRTVELACMARDYGIGESSGKLEFQEIVGALPDLRYLFFWRSVERARSQHAKEGKRLTNFWMVYVHAPWSLKTEDFEYFLEQISQRQKLDDRLVALSAACFLWRGVEEKKDCRRRLKLSVKGEPELETALLEHLNPPPISAELKKHERSMRESKRRQEKRQQENENYKLGWIARLQENPDRLRMIDETNVNALWSDLYWLGMEIRNLSQSKSEFSKNEWELLSPTYGLEVAEAVRDGLMGYWRTYSPQLKSENNSSSIPNGLLIGMIGLAIEAREKPDWPKNLSPDEANLAARYMTLEMNGFPPWASRLLAAYPNECDKVITHELQWEFSAPAEGSPPYHVLHDLEYYAEELRAHYRPFVIKLLEQNDPAHPQTLESALTILLQWHDLCLVSFTELARKRCLSATEEGRYLTWLVVWMCIDADGAFLKLRQWIGGAGDSAEADRRMIQFSGALMNHRSIRFGSVYRDFERVEILRNLIPLVYSHVRIDEDARHEGAYTPGARDNAETTRGYLLEKVCNTPGRGSFDALMEFSQSLPNEWSRERMIVLARQRAGSDSEFEVWQPSNVAEFAREGEKNSRNERELFNLVVSRLDDIKLDLEDGDFSEASLLLKIQQETEMRNWFANRFRLLAKGKYTVSPEEELADAKRPDLRFHTTVVDTPIVIELKIADNWSYDKHCERLNNQLVGQYLRDARSNFGIYLIVWKGKQQKWIAGKRLNFCELLVQLQREADSIVKTNNEVESLLIVGIDLTRRGR